jgi:hypothetical protein
MTSFAVCAVCDSCSALLFVWTHAHFASRYDSSGPFSRFQRFLWNRKMFRRANDRSITVHGSPFSATCNKVGRKSRARAIYEGVEKGCFQMCHVAQCARFHSEAFNFGWLALSQFDTDTMDTAEAIPRHAACSAPAFKCLVAVYISEHAEMNCKKPLCACMMSLSLIRVLRTQIRLGCFQKPKTVKYAPIKTSPKIQIGLSRSMPVKPEMHWPEREYHRTFPQ